MTLAHDIKRKDKTKDVQILKDVTFENMLLAPNTLQGLKESGFYRPSPIQLLGIPLGKCGFDLLLEAKSGTGKTAVFSVIALEKIDLKNGLQVIILAPTREIAAQICDVLRQIGSCYKGLSIEVVMGGLPVQDDIKKFSEGSPHIVVGSPGRLKHLIYDKHIDISAVRLFVLDEADKLMEKSFLVDIKYIHSILPKQKQVIMSSATYPDSSKDFISQFVCNAQHICPSSNSVLLGVNQKFTNVKYNSNVIKQTQLRFKELLEILSKVQFKQCLIFCNYQARVAELHKMLTKEKWPAEQLHGQQDQTVRLDALKTLQEYKCRILISTDLASRGIDASNIDLVINFEPPFEWQTYLHRIGRAGRFGSYGTAITILSEGTEHKKYMNMVKSLNAPIALKQLWDDDSSCSENESEHMESQELQTKKNIQISNGKELLKLINPDDETDEEPKESFSDLLNSYQNYNNTDLIEDENIKPQKELCSSKCIESQFPVIKECLTKNKLFEVWQFLCPHDTNISIETLNDLVDSYKDFDNNPSRIDVEYKCLHLPQLRMTYYQSDDQSTFKSYGKNSSSNDLLDLYSKHNVEVSKEENESNEKIDFNHINQKEYDINSTHFSHLSSVDSDAIEEDIICDKNKSYCHSYSMKSKPEVSDTKLNLCRKHGDTNLWNIDNADFLKLGLPTAFGSSKDKRKNTRNHKIKEQNDKHNHEPIKLWDHKPNRHSADSVLSKLENNSRNNMHGINQKLTSHDSDYSSNDHKHTASCSRRSKEFTKNNSYNEHTNQNLRKHANSQPFSDYQNDYYNSWYRQLKLRVKQIEMIVYMNELRRINS